MTDKKTAALKLALEALEALSKIEPGCYNAAYIASAAIREALAEQPAQQLTELQKDAANLLFALHDAWPYVHQWCSIDSRKQNIVHLMRKHGDFADLYTAQQQGPVAHMNQNGVIHPAGYEWEGAGNILTPLYTSPQPAQQHIDHCLWARNGNQPCPHVQPAQQPVACLVETEQGVMLWPIDDVNEAGTYCEENEFPVLLYTSPQPSKPWVGLTDEEINDCDPHEECWNLLEVAKAIEAKLKEKNA